VTIKKREMGTSCKEFCYFIEEIKRPCFYYITKISVIRGGPNDSFKILCIPFDLKSVHNVFGFTLSKKFCYLDNFFVTLPSNTKNFIIYNLL